MADPAYVSSVDVHFNNSPVKCAVFVAGPPKILIRFDVLDDKGKADLAYLVAQNGAALPFVNLDPLYDTVLENGQTYFNTYVKSLVSMGTKPVVPGSPVDSSLQYYNGANWVSITA